jgi:hypothetical protein
MGCSALGFVSLFFNEDVGVFREIWFMVLL